ncbi:MAG: ferrous iron transport protein B [Bacteroidales bacterium]|nr:ferrous iron transport protein B [Bacteroidales bacterium]
MTLLDVALGEKAIISKVRGRGAFRKRITEMGFVVGKEVTVIKKAPLQDPIEYSILGYNVSLRNSEARLIEVEDNTSAPIHHEANYSGTFVEAQDKADTIHKGKVIHVALVGNPNSGKTTLFNHASGSKERVGNYSGVTIDAKDAHLSQNGYDFIITDLPGTYSITAYTPEELYVRDFINEKMPDVVVNVVDASNLERNLYLTTQLIDMDIQVIVALNMYDELQKKGDKLDYIHLGQMLGIPFVPTVASRGKGIIDLFTKIIEVFEGKDTTTRHIHINYGKTIEQAIKEVQKKLKVPANVDLLDTISSRFLAIKLLEKDASARNLVRDLPDCDIILETSSNEIARIEHELRDDSETLVTDAKYGFISGALAETMRPGPKAQRRKSEIIDIFITHRFWGIPIFIFFMWLTFFGTFSLGKYPMEGIQWLVQESSGFLRNSMPEGILRDLVVDGIIGGVGGVIVFLPNILLLYLFISLMEDSGYMARAVFIMDKLMHKIGLHGKSFIPLVMGFGCNVPAILSTRVIESRRDRIITMLINPFMSCSARLPVYILFISAFFNNHQGSILFGMYFTGILLAVGSALLFRKTLFRKKDVPFVMELPPYRVPTVKSVLRHMWHRAGQYLRKIGGVILVASVIIWALGYFPHHLPDQSKYDSQFKQIEQKYAGILKEGTLNAAEKDSLLTLKGNEDKEVKLTMQAELQLNSYIGRIGRFIEPVMAPLGFDWKMSVAILTGVSAKEVVVGTLGILFQADEGSQEGNLGLVQRLQTQKYTYGPKIGQPVFTPVVALSFMLFILIYFPCIGVISAISKESGSWKWALFIVVYTTALAYLASLLLFQIAS